MSKVRIAPKTRPPNWSGKVTVDTGNTSTDQNVTRRAHPAHGNISLTTADEDKKGIPFLFGVNETSGSIRYAKYVGTTLYLVRVLALGERSITALGAESAGRMDSVQLVTTETGGTLYDPANSFANHPYFSLIAFYPGTLTQGVDATLLGIDPTWNETLIVTNPATGEQRALCYAIEGLNNYPTYWAQNGGVPKARYRLKGSRLLDPRTAVTAYTENWALQFRYWLMDPDGRNLPPSLVGSFNAVADICDQVLGSGKRYATHPLIESGTTDDWIKMFCLLGDAFFFEKEGIWNVMIDRPGSPVASYNDLNYTSAKSIEAGAPEDTLAITNKVTVEYTDTSGFPPWKKAEVSLSSAGLLAGTENEVEARFQMPEIHDRAIAQTKLPYLLYKDQDDFRINLNWRANTGDRAIGDIVTQAIPERGLTDDFRVIARQPLEDNTYDVELQLMSARKYADTSTAPPAKVGSTLPDYFAAPPDIDVATIAFSETLFNEQVGDVGTRGRLSWTNPTTSVFPWLAGVEVELSINGGEFRSLEGKAATPFFVYLAELGTYNFRLKVRSLFGVTSAGVTKSFTVVGKTALPTDVPRIVVSAIGGRVIGFAQQATDIDLQGYEWRFGRTTDTWDSARLIEPRRIELDCELPYSGEQPGGVWRLFCKAYDSGYRYSANAATADVALLNLGPALGVTMASFTPTLVNTGIDLYVQDLGNGASLIVEGVFFPPRDQIAMLIRNLTPAQVDAEIASHSFTSLQQWNDANPYNLWGPLPIPASGRLSGTCDNLGGSQQLGTQRRNIEARVALASPSRLGDSVPNALPLVEVGYGGTFSNSGVFRPATGQRPALRLSTNYKFAQSFVRVPAGGFAYHITEERIIVPIETVVIQTDVNGDATYTLTRPMGAQQIPDVTLTVVGATGAHAQLTATPTNTGFSIKTYDLNTGAALGNVTIIAQIEDRGRGGTSLIIAY